MLLIITPEPSEIVALPLPAPLKVAVSPLAGTGSALQSVPVAQIVFVAPFHVALDACADRMPSPATASPRVHVMRATWRKGELSLWFLGFMTGMSVNNT